MSFDLGGNSGRYFSFGPRGSQPGAWIDGTVVDKKEVQATDFKTNKPEFWDNGDPKMQYRVTLQTDLRDPQDQTDTGLRDIYLDGRRRPNDDGTMSKLCAVLEAVRAVTGGTALAPGGRLMLHWASGLGETGDPRCYQARYAAPTMDVGGQQPAPPPAMQQQPATWTTTAAPPPQQQPTQQGPPPGWAQPAQQPAAAAPIAQTEQGQVNTQTGEIQAPAGPTPEQVAAVRAAGLDPTVVFAGQPLPPGV